MAENNKNKGSILTVSKAQEYKTIEELFSHSQSNSSYYTLLLLSAFIITSGLLIDNSAIVIGGMLVTPVLTPVMVIALGLAVGELGAIKRVAGLVLKSFLIIIAAAFILAVLFGKPEGTLTLENTFRAALLYFVVSIAAGVAGAFAWARKEISEVLPGIAIAVSLVPPLALVGVWLSAFNFDTSRFYFLIFLFNFIGIIVGSLVVFSLLKFYRLQATVHKEAAQAAKGQIKTESKPETKS